MKHIQSAQSTTEIWLLANTTSTANVMKVSRSVCLTLWSLDCNLPVFSVHGCLQARILEWVAISYSRGSSWPRDQTQVSCIAGRLLTAWVTRWNIRGLHPKSKKRQKCPLSQLLGRPLEQEMSTHSSVLGLKIPWTEEPGTRRSMGL